MAQEQAKPPCGSCHTSMPPTVPMTCSAASMSSSIRTASPSLDCGGDGGGSPTAPTARSNCFARRGRRRAVLARRNSGARTRFRPPPTPGASPRRTARKRGSCRTGERVSGAGAQPSHCRPRQDRSAVECSNRHFAALAVEATAGAAMATSRSVTPKLPGPSPAVRCCSSMAHSRTPAICSTSSRRRWPASVSSTTPWTAQKKYDRVIFFEHATLSVSPLINALNCGRGLRRVTGTTDHGP